MDKEYVMQIADTIRQQLLATTPMNVIWSWGALHGFFATEHKDMATLMFKVNGRLFKGDVLISYNEMDYYATYLDHKVNIVYIHSEKVSEANIDEKLRGLDGVVIAPGFGQRGIEGKFIALKWCREHDVPTFGICLGMQCMVIEFARNVLGLEDANSTEMDTKTPHNVIDLMEEQKSISNMGGTMRLGAYECSLRPGSRVAEAYGKTDIMERHRHRFEFNEEYRDRFEKGGMQCVGENPATHLVEVVEIPEKRWFIGTQYHPEYQSTVLEPNPLFLSFVKAAIDYSDEKAAEKDI